MATPNTANLDIDLLSESEDIRKARALLADRIGEAAWQIPVNMVVNLVNTVLGASLGYASAKSGGDFGSGFNAGSKIIPTPPASDMTQRGLSNISDAANWVDNPFRKTGEFVENVTGSRELGTAAHLTTSFLAPTAFLKLLSGATRPGAAMGPHFGIDVRGQGDLLSKVVQRGAQAATGRNVSPGFYSPVAGGREAAVIESALRASGSAVKSALSPSASAILKKHGLSPTSIARINKSRADMAEEGVSAKKFQHAEKVMIAELRKAYGMRLKAGESISPELLSVVRQYHPRLVETKGLPNPKQLNEVLGEDIPDDILNALISDMPKTMQGERTNILTLGGNPSKTAMSGPEKKKIASENPTELFVTGGMNTYGMVGDIWSRMMAGERFYVTSWNTAPKINWIKPGHSKYDSEGIHTEFNSDSVNYFMSAKAKKGEYEAAYHSKANPNIQSKGVRARDVKINGDDYLLYHTVSRSDDPLLASVPASVLFNPRTGVSRILSADELDIFERGVRRVTEAGFPNRFWTLNYGKYTYDDKLLERAGLGKGPQTKLPPETPVDRAQMNIDIDAMMDASATGELAQRAALPVTVQATRRKREDSQARNIY